MRKYIAERHSLQGTGITVYREIIPDDPNQPILLKIGRIRKEAVCPSCCRPAAYHYDTRKRLSRIRHLDYHGRAVYLVCHKRRFKCTDCQKVFTEQFSTLVQPRQRKTILFSHAALHHLKNHTFKDTQKQFRISFSYLILQLYDSINHTSSAINWEKEFAGNQTIALGVDEHSHKKRRLVLTITNLTKKKLITILTAYSQRELATFLRSIPSQFRLRIAYAATDLTNRYGAVIKQWLPKVRISADPFHVIRLFNTLLWHEKRVIEGVYRMHTVTHFKLLLAGAERLTSEQRQKVQAILAAPKHRRLKMAYELKEKMRRVLNKDTDTQTARQEFIRVAHSDVWNRNNSVDNRMELKQYSRYYRTCIETMQKWEQEIITVIETRITNGYTEGIHTKIKLLKRLSYGINNPITYIKRMILALSDAYSTNPLHSI